MTEWPNPKITVTERRYEANGFVFQEKTKKGKRTDLASLVEDMVAGGAHTVMVEHE